KMIEALALALQMLVVAALGKLPHQLHEPAWLFGALGVAGAVGVLVFAWRFKGTSPADAAQKGLRARAVGFFERLHEGMYLLRGARVWAVALFWSLVADAAHATTVGLALAAVGVSLHPSLWLVVVLANRFAGVIPSTPGQFG